VDFYCRHLLNVNLDFYCRRLLDPIDYDYDTSTGNTIQNQRRRIVDLDLLISQEFQIMSSELAKLERLSLVSKICTELENHLGLNDKDLAEFIVHLADQNPTFPAFKKALLDNEAEFDDSLISNLLRLIQHMMGRNKKSMNDEHISQDISGKSLHSIVDKEFIKSKLPALALPNEATAASSTVMAELENLLPKWSDAEKKSKNECDRNMKNQKAGITIEVVADRDQLQVITEADEDVAAREAIPDRDTGLIPREGNL
uniref:Uncharacterized protein n=1 Tax=Romanomermis culicivorax TaxID=13658 RepID=A0A915JHK8_ROMCU